MKKTSQQLDPQTCQEMGRSCLGFNLRKADLAVMQIFDEEVRSLDLRCTQFGLLMVARVMEPVALSQLSDHLGIDRTTLSRNLKPLEKRGLVRVVSGEDRRERKLSLTPEGHRLLLKAHSAWSRTQARLVKLIGKTELDRLVDQLQKVTALIQPG
jgi:DNA-binding MarR family transcriptional regulator